MLMYPTYRVLSIGEVQQLYQDIYRYYTTIFNKDIRDWKVFQEGDREIIVISGGLKNTGGHFIMVDNIVNENDKTIITVSEQQPPDHAFVTMAFMNPVTIVEVKKNETYPLKEIRNEDGEIFTQDSEYKY